MGLVQNYPDAFLNSPIKKEPCQKCKGKTEQLETALKLNDFYAADLRRKDAEIAMLKARVAQGNGIDRGVIADLAFIMLEGVMAGRIKLKPEHIAEMRKAARG